MKWTDHIDVSTCTREELITFLKEREQLAWDSYCKHNEYDSNAPFTKAAKQEWGALVSLLHALNIR